MELIMRRFEARDVPAMVRIWNHVVTEGMAFPQENLLTIESGAAFFAEQTVTMVGEIDNNILGLYILHPNNIGRCGHIGNCSYAVHPDCRDRGFGEQLVRNSISVASLMNFRLLQFNAVVASNTVAIHLYKKLGFKVLGHLPEGFYDRNGMYQDTVLFYYDLMA